MFSNDELKDDFATIKDLKNEIENILCYIDIKTKTLQEIYIEYTKNKAENITNLISLDTFNFQTKLIKTENKNNHSIFKLFINRMYGDYYKLYINLLQYTKENIKKIKIFQNNDYPIYKDLEFDKEYSFEIIQTIHSEIISILGKLNNYSIFESHNINDYQKRNNNGININNFVSEKKYSLVIIQEKIKLFIDCIKSYSNFQIKYLKRLIFKFKILLTQINIDINLETNYNFEKNKNSNHNNDEHLNKFNFEIDSNSSNSFEKLVEDEFNKLNEEIILDNNKNQLLYLSDIPINKINSFNEMNKLNINQEIDKLSNTSSSPKTIISDLSNVNSQQTPNKKIFIKPEENSDLLLNNIENKNLIEINAKIIKN